MGKLGGWLGRGKKETPKIAQKVDEAEPEAPIPASELPGKSPGSCFNTHCELPGEYHCVYHDSTLTNCTSVWCREHVEFVGEHCLCRRHANVVRFLQSDGQEWDKPGRLLPPLDDRSVGLVALTFSELNEEILGLLHKRYENTQGVGIDADRLPTPYVDAVTRLFRGWEQGWATYKSEGFVGRILLRAYYGEPPILELIVTGKTQTKGVPDWIAIRRTAPEQIESARATYRRRLILVCEKALGLSEGAKTDVLATTAALRAITVPCRWGGCGKSAIGSCQYMDGQGLRCSTYWCADHLDNIDDLILCRRHHRALTSLARDFPDWRQRKRYWPPVDDRSQNLIEHMMPEIDESVMQMLTDRYAFTQKSVEVDKDRSIHPYTEGGIFKGWERGWAAYTREGFLGRVVLRAYYSEPPEVEILVNRRPVIKGVPDWILARAHGLDVESSRAGYRERVLEQIRSAFLRSAT